MIKEAPDLNKQQFDHRLALFSKRLASLIELGLPAAGHENT